MTTTEREIADYFALPRGARHLGSCAQTLSFCAAPSSTGVILIAA